jgi:hypothetical protein
VNSQILVHIFDCNYEACKSFNPINAKLNPICPLLALFGAHHILHISRIRVKNVKMHELFKKEYEFGG